MGHLSEAAQRVLIDGVSAPLDRARVSLASPGLLRGDGAFETVGVWDGRAFRLGEHLDRLARSLSALALPPLERRRIEQDVEVLLDGVEDDAALRLYVVAGGPRIALLSRQPRRGPAAHLVPLPAPWISPGTVDRSAGAKTLSYAANMAATRRAQQRGGDDALLVTPDGWLLEGPTFGVLFVARGVVHAPEVGLGIVDSVSRRALLEIAAAHSLDVLHGRWNVEVLADAEELIISSALRAPQAVQRVGDWTLPRTSPVCDLLAQDIEAQRRGHLQRP